MTLLLSAVCVFLGYGWWTERSHSEFWLNQWRRETAFCKRLLGIHEPKPRVKLRVIQGGKL